jgi:SAM-dependent methyltransferase
VCDLVNLDYITNHFNTLEGIHNVLEVGSFNVNGNCKNIILSKGLRYLGIDIQDGPDVDLICNITDDIEHIERKLNHEKFDLIICMNVLEHLYEPIKALTNMRHLLRGKGYLMIVTPLVWDLHDWPHDFYRLNPDFYKKYTQDNNLQILEGTFLLSTRDSRKFYSNIKVLPMLIPHIYKGVIEKNDFSEVVPDSKGLLEDLIKNNYIDEKGLLQHKFATLRDLSEFILGPKYILKKGEIFSILQKSYIGLIFNNLASAAAPELRECWPHIYLNLICQQN